ncbi:MAG: hypothetical protein IPI67_11260 [Myxococcales bacterium]|nr:hypothetical protein [Myxococcales bacterium]
MRLRTTVLFLAVGLALPTACKKDKGGCADGPNFAKLALPATLHIYRSGSYLGAITVPAVGAPTFAAAAGAPEDRLKAFHEDFDPLVSSDKVSVKYETASGDTHYMCGATVNKGTPEYADALRAHFFGKYYEVQDRAP